MKLTAAINYIFSFRPQTSRRYAWVDYAKGIAIIFVLYRHVIYGLLYTGANINQLMMEANEMLYGFRMPLFFFLSGLFFASSVKKRGPRNFLISKINTLLYPYLLWCVIQVTLQILFTDYTNHKLTVDNYIDILIHPRSMLQLWYLAALFNVSALYLFTSTVLKLHPAIQVVLGLVMLGMKSYAGDISTISDVMIYYVYFALGHLSAPYFFSENVQQQLTSPWKALALVPVFLLVQYYCMSHQDMSIYLFSLLATLGGLLVIMIAFILAKYEKLKVLQTIGHYSLYIYLLHLGIIFLLRVAILKTGILTNIPVITVILVTAGLFGSIILYRFCMLVRLNFLFTGPFKERDVTKNAVGIS
nr:acyltransferase [uncultured Chitinophaga sp.]